MSPRARAALIPISKNPFSPSNVVRIPSIVSIDLYSNISLTLEREIGEWIYVVQNVNHDQDGHSEVDFPQEFALKCFACFSATKLVVCIVVSGYIILLIRASFFDRQWLRACAISVHGRREGKRKKAPFFSHHVEVGVEMVIRLGLPARRGRDLNTQTSRPMSSRQDFRYRDTEPPGLVVSNLGLSCSCTVLSEER